MLIMVTEEDGQNKIQRLVSAVDIALVLLTEHTHEIPESRWCS